MEQPQLTVTPVPGLPDVQPGDDLASLIAGAMRKNDLRARSRDVFVVAQKIISKAEGRLLRLDSIEPSRRAAEWAATYDKDPRLIEVVLREAKSIIRMDQGVIVAETSHGLICANAGVDASNVAEGTVSLLPEDPIGSARRLRAELESLLGVDLALIVSDTFGRPWREGLVNVALGFSGIAPLIDYRGQLDWHGQPLRVTTIAVVDELASAAELVMGKSRGVPVVVISGADYEARESGLSELIRAPEKDLFR
jgi:coenzyme F420-0:L-glutamate ligase/coenzyme F420-1:gamma-L-glutamate ligase